MPREREYWAISSELNRHITLLKSNACKCPGTINTRPNPMKVGLWPQIAGRRTDRRPELQMGGRQSKANDALIGIQKLHDVGTLSQRPFVCVFATSGGSSDLRGYHFRWQCQKQSRGLYHL
jgi:hypothetical protein